MHKIVILNNDLDLGGIQKSLIDFLIHLDNKGFEVDLVLWQKGGVLTNWIPKNINIIVLNYPSTWKSIINEKSFVKKAQKMAQYLKFNFYTKIVKKPWLFFPKIKKKYDTAISYSQNGYPRFFAIDNIIAEKKYLWYHHGSYETQGKMFNLDKKYYAKFDNIVTVSRANKKMLESHFSDYANKIFVVPNIIDVNKVLLSATEPIVDCTMEDGIFNFVTVSRFSKEKGIDLAIDIATELKNKGLKVKWYFLGDGDTFSEIQNTIKIRSLENNCLLLGMKENPYPYMKQADLYIQTSYVESQSITICEALALNKIIVTTNLPVLNDVLQNGKLGVLCNLDANSFAHEIHKLLYDKVAQDRLKTAVEQHVVSNDFTYQAIEELLKNIN